MRILIVESEIYLAQSISSKLTEIGYQCTMASSCKKAIQDAKYDAVLLSTNISGQNFYPVIEKHKNSIIILMISYISNDTVSNPLKAGANDYIQKPFMIEELIRKLEHLEQFNALKKENDAYGEYINNLFNNTMLKALTKKTKLPLLLKANFQKDMDIAVFNFARDLNESFAFISLSCCDAIEKIDKIPNSELLYITNFENLDEIIIEKIIGIIKNKRVILSSTDVDSNKTTLNELKIEDSNTIFNQAEILSISNYTKYIIQNFQYKFSDVELSKKLGISRKSLWEKRRKYEIKKEK